MKTQIIAALVGGATLALPGAAAADAGHGKAEAKRAGKVADHHGKGTLKTPKKVTFVFEGSLGADGTVQVRSGNAHARKGGFLGQAVAFDFASAKVVSADTNADGA